MGKSIWLILGAVGLYLFSKARAAFNLEYTLTGIKVRGSLLNPSVEISAIIYNSSSLNVLADTVEGEILINGERVANARVIGSLNIPANGFQTAVLLLSNITMANIASVANFSNVVFQGFATVGGGRVKIPLSKKLR